ncbi:MAG: hypothetical protein IJ523_01270 [Succinivibrionaceae bacterium]|nr:hypothetical protein [Succinivibrionaceae bacterium]
MGFKYRRVAAIMGLFSMLGLAGTSAGACAGECEGGIVDNSDPSAPVVIESGELVRFQATFYLRDRWTAGDQHNFDFAVEPDGSGQLMLTEKISGFSMAADGKLLEKLQKVITRRKLAEKNGVNRYTAGLPPEFQPNRFLAGYASGEKIFFVTDNDPVAAWAEDVYQIMADYALACGSDAFYPPAETAPVVRFRMAVTKGGKTVMYLMPKDPDGIARLTKVVYDATEDRTEEKTAIPVPEDYFAAIGDIVARHRLTVKYDFSYPYHSKGWYGSGPKLRSEAMATETDAKDLSLMLHMKFANDRRVAIDTRKASEIRGMQPLIDDLLKLHQEYFGRQKPALGAKKAGNDTDSGHPAGDADIDLEEVNKDAAQ